MSKEPFAQNARNPSVQVSVLRQTGGIQRGRSAPNLRHVLGRLDEARLVDQVAFFLTPDGTLDHGSRWSSETPDRIRSRSGVSCRENRQVRRPPSAVSRILLHAVQKAWLTDDMKPTPPGAPSAKVYRVAGPGRGSLYGTSGNWSSICSWIRRLGTTCSLVQMLSPSRGMNSMNRTS